MSRQGLATQSVLLAPVKKVYPIELVIFENFAAGNPNLVTSDICASCQREFEHELSRMGLLEEVATVATMDEIEESSRYNMILLCHGIERAEVVLC